MDEHRNHLIFSHDSCLKCRIPASAFKHILSFDLVSARSQLLILTQLHLEKRNSHEILNKNCVGRTPRGRIATQCVEVLALSSGAFCSLCSCCFLLELCYLEGQGWQIEPVHAAASHPQFLTVCGSPNASIRF